MKVIREERMKKENWIGVLFLIIWGFWFFLMKGTIGYWGETDFFQCGSHYWNQFQIKPGGWSEYIGHFLLQFYQWTGVGALVQTLIPGAVFMLSRGIGNKLGILKPGLWLSSLPWVVLFGLQVGFRIGLAESLRILFLFLFLWGYLQISSRRWRFMLSIALFPVFFLLLGKEGYSVLYANFAIAEIWKRGKNFCWKMGILWLILVLAVPEIWRRWMYVMPAEKVFRTAVALDYGVWVIYGYMLCMWGMERLRFTGFSGEKRGWAELLMVVILCGWGMYAFYNRSAEYYFRMDQAAEQGNWEEVLQIAGRIPEPTREEFYLINLALANRGELGERLFEYPVWGIGCLYLPRETAYRTSVLGGELYYRLKLPNEGLHWTFQASVAAPQGMDFRTLRRLIELNVMKRDTALSDKYLALLENAVGYGAWCKRQRRELRQPVKEMVLPDETHDFFIGGRPFLSDMARLLDAGKSKEMVLDYILCGLLLDKDLGKFCQLMTMFYQADGKRIPSHYQEALLVAMTIDNQAVIQKDYSIDPEINKRFLDYNVLYRTYGKNKQQARKMMKEFRNTWWYYFHFVQPRAVDMKGHLLESLQVYSLN